ncbi:MAG: F0F1 ATP synthase subunit epsilon [Chloroflexota bacterium]
MMPIRCDIVTQERSVFSDQVDAVNLPGAEGRMGILPNHSPLLTALDYGEVVVRKGHDETYFAIGGGLAEIQPDHVIVLADSAEAAEEIDLERAQHARERAEKAMKEGIVDQVRYAEIEAQLRRARIRIDVSLKRQKHLRRPMLTDMAHEE